MNGRHRRALNAHGKHNVKEIINISKPFGRLLGVQQKLEELAVPPEEQDLSEHHRVGTSIDDVFAAASDRIEVIKVRKTEMQFFRDMGVYTKVKREHRMKIILTKWFDVNKGDGKDINYRARLVGKEIAWEKRDDLFAATPPLESLKMILSICASNQNS